MMTEKEFAKMVKDVMDINFEDYNNFDSFYEAYRSGKTFYKVNCYIKDYLEKSRFISFLIDESNIDELKSRVDKINKEIDALIKTVDSPRFHPHFSYFVRSYWNVGYELYIFRRNRLEEEEEERKESEYDYTPSATHGDYSPSCPWDAPGMSIKDFI